MLLFALFTIHRGGELLCTCPSPACTHPGGCIVMGLLAAMMVKEMDIRGRQCLRQDNPGVAQLGSGSAHEGCVAVFPTGRGQQLPQQRRRVWLVPAPDEEGNAPYKDVQSQAVVPLLCPANICHTSRP